MAETVGSLVDKLTIVELKIHHMQEQAKRPDISDEQVSATVLKVNTLITQAVALERELDALAKNPPQPFRQFKMYNDPQYRSTT